MVLIYAHRDREFVEKSTITDFLEDAADEANLDFWWDKKMARGSWKEEIRQRLESADVVVCLVSQPFLRSEFIKDVETRIATRRQKTEGLIVVPVMYTDCRWQRHQWLVDSQRLPADPKRPYLVNWGRRTIVYKEVADHIVGRVKGSGTSRREPRTLYTLRRLSDDDFTDEEVQLLIEDSCRRAKSFVPSAARRRQICHEARKRGASPQSKLEIKELKELDTQFLAQGRRKPDAEYVRWVLRCHRLHPQGTAPRSRRSRS